MTDQRRPLRVQDDAREVSRRLSEAHEQFVSTGRLGPRVRPLVAQSWQRCLRSGVDPERSLAPVQLVDGELEAWRRSHPLVSVLPVVQRLLVEDATDAGFLVALSDAAGRLLWVEGDARLRSRAERMHFVAGADWSEKTAGTNAPGTALALDRPVQIFAAEHLARRATAWSCSAVPIHDPDTGALLGALDLTGGDEVAAPHTLSLVRATVAAAESELRLQRLTAGVVPWNGYRPRVQSCTLHSLGVEGAVLQRADATVRLSLRHSELVVLLAAHPEGLSGEQLSAALSEHELAPVTLRAELSRLRSVLGHELASRPYRLAEQPATDAAEVARLISAGRVGEAVDRYRGPLLPLSAAPGIVRMRGVLHEQLRSSLLAAKDPDALLRFADTEHGRLDWQIWHAASLALAPSSPRCSGVRAQLRLLDAELGPAVVSA